MPKKQFNAGWIDAVKVEKRTSFYDTSIKGLGLRVSPQGNKTFFFRYKYNGGMRRYSIGRYSKDAMPLSKARSKVKELQIYVKKGGDPQGDEMTVKSTKHKSFGELVTAYKTTYLPRLKDSTQKDYTHRINIILSHFKKDRYLKDIKRGDIFNFLDGISTKAPTQAKRIQAILSGLFKFALERDWVDYNPTSGINLSNRKSKGIKGYENVEFSDDDLKTLWFAFEDYSLITGSLFKMLLVLGQRSGETRNMKWSDIDFESKVWTIPGEMTKNGLTHFIPLPGLAINVIESLKPVTGKSKYIFESPVKENTPIGSSQKASERIRKRTGVSDFNIHSLRTTVASKMASLGISQQVLSKVLNHKTSGQGSAITAIYNKYDYDKEKREALTTWNNYLHRLISNDNSNVLKMSS